MTERKWTFETDDVFSRLEAWYTQHCNGDWEHQFGVRIGTLDNPGWSFEADLQGTSFQDASLERQEAYRSEHNWVVYWIEGQKFKAAGGPLNLREIIAVFLNFVEQ